MLDVNFEKACQKTAKYVLLLYSILIPETIQEKGKLNIALRC